VVQIDEKKSTRKTKTQHQQDRKTEEKSIKKTTKQWVVGWSGKKAVRELF